MTEKYPKPCLVNIFPFGAREMAFSFSDGNGSAALQKCQAKTALEGDVFPSPLLGLVLLGNQVSTWAQERVWFPKSDSQ